jgi:RNA polymerase sigma-70 factor (TIGR02960 family)
MDLLVHAKSGDQNAFRELTDPHRRALQLHCYRILGSLQDAEDMVQETLLAAWGALEGFEGRSTLRGWLYRIATNRCLNALRDSGRRPQPAEPSFAVPAPTRFSEPLWLEPYPDVLVDEQPGPEARYESKQAIELAFVAALQQLTPAQRAALVLRDVLGFSTAEVAGILDTTDTSVKGLLQRARTALDVRGHHAPSAAESALAQRFADAFAAADVDGVIALLTDDATLSMPPLPHEYQGTSQIAEFLRSGFARHPHVPGRTLLTRANGQPAVVVYFDDPHGAIAHATGLVVLTLRGDRVSAMTRFDPGVLRHFGIPRTLSLGVTYGR